jgi:hypothetical protein
MTFYIWDFNQINSVAPSDDLLLDGYAADTPPTSGNTNYTFYKMTNGLVPVGLIKPFIGISSQIPAGWLDFSSYTYITGSQYDYLQNLFVLLWNSMPDLTITPNRGASALADWAAGKNLYFPGASIASFTGQSLAVGNPYNAPLGKLVGSNETQLSLENIPSLNLTITDPGHTHSIPQLWRYEPPPRTNIKGFAQGYGIETVLNPAETGSSFLTKTVAPLGNTTRTDGLGNPFSVIPPSFQVIFIIKY